MTEAIVTGVGALSALVAAVCWALSARVEIRDRVDLIVGDLQRAARWNSRGAGAAVVSAVCAVVLFARELMI
ncbi:MAG: hypothetical protein RLO50_14515 [Azospirillaceae bacterium]